MFSLFAVETPLQAVSCELWALLNCSSEVVVDSKPPRQLPCSGPSSHKPDFPSHHQTHLSYMRCAALIFPHSRPNYDYVLAAFLLNLSSKIFYFARNLTPLRDFAPWCLACSPELNQYTHTLYIQHSTLCSTQGQGVSNKEKKPRRHFWESRREYT